MDQPVQVSISLNTEKLKDSLPLIKVNIKVKSPDRPRLQNTSTTQITDPNKSVFKLANLRLNDLGLNFLTQRTEKSPLDQKRKYSSRLRIFEPLETRNLVLTSKSFDKLTRFRMRNKGIFNMLKMNPKYFKSLTKNRLIK